MAVIRARLMAFVMASSLVLVGASAFAKPLKRTKRTAKPQVAPAVVHKRTGGRSVKGSRAKSAPMKTAVPVGSDSAPPSAPAAPTATAAAAPPPSRGPTRIDFDDRLIQGQTNRSGAVYLYDRKELETRSMLKKRESFREEIIGSI